MPRYIGYKTALQKHGLVFNDRLVKECKVATEEEGYEFALQYMKMKSKPDGIFAVNDETAIGVLAALRKLNIRVPQDVGVVGFSNTKASLYMQPSLTSIEQFGFDIGKVATEVLIELINTKTDTAELMHRKTLLEPKLFIRESSMRVPKSN